MRAATVLFVAFTMLLPDSTAGQDLALDRRAEGLQPAVRLAEEGRRAEAVAWLEAHLSSHPTDSYGWFRLGVEREALQRWHESADAYRRSAEFAPHAVWGLHQSAAMEARAGRPRAAVVDLRKAFTRGYADHEEIKADPDFDSIRGHDGFRQVVADMTNAPLPRMDRRSSWSPGGDSIVFSSSPEGESSWSLFIVAADGTGRRRLTNDSHHDLEPAWSPDGQWIVFSRINAHFGGKELHLIRPDGSELHRLTGPGRVLEGGFKGFAEWVGDGDRLVVSVSGFGVTSGIHLIRTDGSDATRLTDSGDWPGPDGRGAVVYDGPILFKVPLEGGEPTALVEDANVIWWATAVSADGSTAASSIFSRGGRFNQLALTDLRTGAMTVLTPPEFDVFMPSWSPSGDRLAFARSDNAYGHGGRVLYVINRDGSGLRPLVQERR